MALTDTPIRPHLPPLDLSAIEALPLDPLTKGIPHGTEGLRLGAVGARGWSLLADDLPLPVAVLREDRLAANSRWMAEFVAANDLLLAPHGKTTMAPQLFDRQVRDGSWAITVATAQQLAVCRRFGVRRVLLANQPAGANVASVLSAVADGGMEVYCLADTPGGLAALADGARRTPVPPDNPLRVLVEVGFPGGRTGARTPEAALEVARQVAEAPGLVLAGFECFEGLLADTAAVDAFLDTVVAVAHAAEAEGLLPADGPPILSAGGSSFFDRVGERFGQDVFGRPFRRVLRAGCYITHDSITYDRHFDRIRAETHLTLPPGGLRAALEVWAAVQSRPEAERAILTMGKRDVGFDAGLPVPLHLKRHGTRDLEAMPDGHAVVALNDQHCHMAVPADSPLAAGDVVGFGIGHPCTTFDRWAVLFTVGGDWRVTGAVKTFF